MRRADGGWTLDPDTQVRERLDYVFDSFRRHGVVRAVVRDLKEQGLELPTRVTATEGYGSLVWKAPTLSTVIRILHNPAYAGAYVYGRWEYLSERRSPKTGKASAHARSVAQWPVKITEHHPAYVRWEEFVKNQEQLRENWNHEGNRGVPREGRALLQGIVYCGVCGRKMSVQDRAARENRSPSYICGRGYQDGDEKTCQSMTSRPVDAAVVEVFLGAVSPISLRVAIQVLDQLEQDLIAQRRQRELQLEQARYEARLAQRQYDAVDPVEPFGGGGVGAAVERKAGACGPTGADAMLRRNAMPSGTSQPRSERPSRSCPKICRRFGVRRRPPTRNASSYCAWRSNPCNWMGSAKRGRSKYRFVGALAR